ncbi:hypothetical protein BGL34_00705 [Fructilactobacillus lindneri]|uniref:Uncharacterized protein n=2 Tax=Fructilactobacillus lindneri TaxID=53444 RepID=A0A0R2JPS2_9LACO|nr:hypothetical protein [Fructilactobacillus lindneri]ANZ58301.1 hypothetical protein AYR60_05875 [Fructilactobacillus lindneri]ANZ59623.1 hypothetical protein AYR59_06130 [Fructilactobacillus lindneri]KRN79129.1 hypothetical protein IV52_GL000534 [Fructilactobacillus lindneri DSM 20690 = JCM 11027]POG98593.1 hypothetical protein BGL31_01295 [Fructilactobacillus lindneri]POH03981.1 hypothetical protein BGL32_01235 [Fructilactobacillus lindneri]
MKKFLLSVTGASMIALTGISVTTINQPSVYASNKSFPKEVQGKWNNQAGNTFKIKGSKAILKIANSKKKGTYKFKLKSKIDEGFKLKADGKKLDKTNDYSLTTSKNGTMQFNYGKQKIQFNNETMNSKQTNKSSVNKDNPQVKNNTQQNNNVTQQKSTKNVSNNQNSNIYEQNSSTNNNQQNNYENSDPNSSKFYDETDGTYHAPGSNPDGTPDPWVQGQLDWLAQHPEENNVTVQDDGTVTQN